MWRKSLWLSLLGPCWLARWCVGGCCLSCPAIPCLSRSIDTIAETCSQQALLPACVCLPAVLLLLIGHPLDCSWMSSDLLQKEEAWEEAHKYALKMVWFRVSQVRSGHATRNPQAARTAVVLLSHSQRQMAPQQKKVVLVTGCSKVRWENNIIAASLISMVLNSLTFVGWHRLFCLRGVSKEGMHSVLYSAPGGPHEGLGFPLCYCCGRINWSR